MHSHQRHFFLLIVGLTLVIMVQACISQPQIDPLELRAQALAKALMCPVCPGESIDQSQVPLAYQMKAIVRAKLTEGLTDQEIKAFFAERYGPEVLMEPPTQGFNLLAWLVPPVGIGVAFFGLFLTLRHLQANRREDGPLLNTNLSEERSALLQERVEATLAKDIDYVGPQTNTTTRESTREGN